MITLLAPNASNAGNGFLEFISLTKEAFKNFSFFDVIDIILLTVIFFLAFMFLKSRKAGALIIGIAVCALLLTVATFLGLEGTKYLFSGLFQIGALAIVIIFQPEIRDGLERLGSGSISGIIHLGHNKKKKQAYVKAIENICNAVTDLSHTKTGALIVIQRTTQLEDIVQTGIVINADVQSALLRNIFFNRAPLHDGAVVIDDDAHIVAAGCLLPLARRQNIDEDLGTRHRAAIGMSETSDAIIIVISEETGVISVALDCELTRNYTADSLRKLLFRKLLRENITSLE